MEHQKNRCEYRIVNSHGNECHNVIQNEEVSCTNHGGMWVSESYLRLMHFGHDYATGQLPSKRPLRPSNGPRRSGIKYYRRAPLRCSPSND